MMGVPENAAKHAVYNTGNSNAEMAIKIVLRCELKETLFSLIIHIVHYGIHCRLNLNVMTSNTDKHMSTENQ